MSVDAIFKEAIIFIAAAAAIIKFAILECEGVLATWRRVTAGQKSRAADDKEITIPRIKTGQLESSEFSRSEK